MERDLHPQLTFCYWPKGWQNLGWPKWQWSDEDHLRIHRNRS